MQHELTDLEKDHKKVIIIFYVAMNVAILIFIYLGWAGYFKGSGNSTLPVPLNYLGMLLALPSLYFHFMSKTAVKIKKSLQQNPVLNAPPQTFFSIYFTTMVLSLAFNEAIAIFGLVSMVSNGVSFEVFLINAAIALILNIFMFPTPMKTYEEYKRLS